MGAVKCEKSPLQLVVTLREMGPTGVPRDPKKISLSKILPRPLWMPNHAFSRLRAPLDPFWPFKVPTSLETAPFGANMVSKRGLKTRFPNVITDHWECPNTCLWPVWSRFGPPKSQTALKIGHFWDQNRVTKGSKMRVFTSGTRPLGASSALFSVNQLAFAGNTKLARNSHLLFRFQRSWCCSWGASRATAPATGSWRG